MIGTGNLLNGAYKHNPRLPMKARDPRQFISVFRLKQKQALAG
jgi:hypothetical protein